MQQTFAAGGKLIHIEVHEPAASAAPAPAVILLHGAGGNVGFWLDRLAPLAVSGGLCVYAPHYFQRTGTGRADVATITDGVHVPLWLDTLAAALAWVAARPAVDPARIALVGISLGGFLALCYAAQQSAQPSPAPAICAVVELSGGLVEPFASQATSRFPPTLILHGAADTIVPVAQAHALDALLNRLNVPHATHILPNEGHWFSGPAQMQLLLAVSNFLSRYLQVIH
jgi:carboxymethylenebutenolidase